MGTSALRNLRLKNGQVLRVEEDVSEGKKGAPPAALTVTIAPFSVGWVFPRPAVRPSARPPTTPHTQRTPSAPRRTTPHCTTPHCTTPHQPPPHCTTPHQPPPPPHYTTPHCTTPHPTTPHRPHPLQDTLEDVDVEAREELAKDYIAHLPANAALHAGDHFKTDDVEWKVIGITSAHVAEEDEEVAEGEEAPEEDDVDIAVFDGSTELVFGEDELIRDEVRLGSQWAVGCGEREKLEGWGLVQNN